MRGFPMNTDFGQLIDGFAGLHVLVIGDAMLDTYLQGSTDRLCPEAPVPVVAVSARRDVPGGAASKQVVAFYSRDSLDPAVMRDRLGESLPKYMIPSAFQRVANMN